MTISDNRPDYRVTLDGQDLTSKIRPRLVSLTLTDKREEADQLDIVIDDSDGRMALPKEGARISVSIGWSAGPDVAIGLVEKGSFTVDDVSHGGPPDQITIRARSADFTGASELRGRREESWKDTTLGAVIRDIAARQKLTAQIAADLASIQIRQLHQSRESDVAFLRRLGREHSATVKIKAGKLIFAAIGAGATASGKALPSYTFTRRMGDTHSYERRKREEYSGVTASYHDRGSAKKEKVVVGDQKGARHLSRVYASKGAATRAANAAKSRAARAPASMSVKAALGDARLYAEQIVQVQGFKPDIDGTRWIAKEVKHNVTNDGFTSDLSLEVAP